MVLLGVIAGFLLAAAFHAKAATIITKPVVQFIERAWQREGSFSQSQGTYIDKWVDSSNGVTCYYASVGISCIKAD